MIRDWIVFFVLFLWVISGVLAADVMINAELAYKDIRVELNVLSDKNMECISVSGPILKVENAQLKDENTICIDKNNFNNAYYFTRAKEIDGKFFKYFAFQFDGNITFTLRSHHKIIKTKPKLQNERFLNGKKELELEVWYENPFEKAKLKLAIFAAIVILGVMIYEWIKNKNRH